MEYLVVCLEIGHGNSTTLCHFSNPPMIISFINPPNDTSYQIGARFRVCLSAVLVILGMACVARVCVDTQIDPNWAVGYPPFSDAPLMRPYLLIWLILLRREMFGDDAM